MRVFPLCLEAWAEPVRVGRLSVHFGPDAWVCVHKPRLFLTHLVPNVFPREFLCNRAQGALPPGRLPGPGR